MESFPAAVFLIAIYRNEQSQNGETEGADDSDERRNGWHSNRQKYGKRDHNSSHNVIDKGGTLCEAILDRVPADFQANEEL